jgi:hypothetical protein
MRYGFLFNGYEIDRLSDKSGIVVSWEATVMIRKLFITLAGSTISDAYLQILAALMILISALGLQAFFQPYIPDLLDVLDTLGLFTLLCTQILSILYLYSETAERPVLPQGTLEIVVTVALFSLNAIAIITFALVWICYFLGCNYTQLCCRKLKQMRVVNDKAVIEQARKKLMEGGDASKDVDGQLYWRHPETSVALTHPPEEVVLLAGIGYVWTDENGIKSWSDSAPTVITAVSRGEKAEPGEFVCTMHPKTMQLSPLEEVLPDVMSKPGEVKDSKNVEPSNEQTETLPATQEGVVKENNDTDDDDDAPEIHEAPSFAGHNPMQQSDNRVVVLDSDIQQQQKEARQKRRNERKAMRRLRSFPTESDREVRVDPRTAMGVELHKNPLVEDKKVSKSDSSSLSPEQRRNQRKARRRLRESKQGDVVRIDVAAETGGANGSMNPLFDKSLSSNLPLPRGWREHVREFDGKIYYSSEHTKETAWDRPTLPAAPRGFEVRAHEKYGHYFKNINTGEKQWHHPDDEEGY